MGYPDGIYLDRAVVIDEEGVTLISSIEILLYFYTSYFIKFIISRIFSFFSPKLRSKR